MSSLASATTLQAFFRKGQLLLKAEGQKPTPCHRVWFEPLRMPDTYELRWEEHGPCVEVITQYREVAVFAQSRKPEHVTIITRTGQREVAVQELSSVQTGGQSQSLIATEGVEGVGYSSSYSYGEALHAAIADAQGKLPPSQVFDGMLIADVTYVGAEIGGFVGVNHLVVKVKARYSP